MSENGTDNRSDLRWRDPLSIGWQAHRRLLLLKLRWHQSSAQRGSRTRVAAKPATRLTLRTGRGRLPTGHPLGRRQRTR